MKSRLNKSLLLSIVMCSSCLLATAFSTVAWFTAKRNENINNSGTTIFNNQTSLLSYSAYKFDYSVIGTDENILVDYDNPQNGKVIELNEDDIKANKAQMNIFDPAYLIVNENVTLYDMHTNIVYKVVLDSNLSGNVNVIISLLKKEMERDDSLYYISRYADIQAFSQKEVEDCINNVDYLPAYYATVTDDNKTANDPMFYAVSYLAWQNKKAENSNVTHLYANENGTTVVNDSIVVKNDIDSIDALKGSLDRLTYYISVDYSPSELADLAFTLSGVNIPVYFDCVFNVKVEGVSNNEEN